MTNTTNEQGFISAVYEGKTCENLHTYLFACFLSQEEPKKEQENEIVARIEAIRLFLAYASFKDFVVYQMDVKSAFLYGKIERGSLWQDFQCHNLKFPHLNVVKRILDSLKGTQNQNVADLLIKAFDVGKFQYLIAGSGYHQKDRKPSQNDKTEHGMEKTVQRIKAKVQKMPKSEYQYKKNHSQTEPGNLKNTVWMHS
ncbi:putative ribonuclease H-like domain-containing protein [Tanacetum coccineum]